MEIRAYDEIYLDGAQSILGHAVDFAVMTLDIPPNRFGQAFAVSDCSRQFAAGNPSYIAGMNGCELARAVLDEVHIPYPETEDVMYTDKSPEYWAGWMLCFYQWFVGCSFLDILTAVPLEEMIAMYPVFHEMDIMASVDAMNEKMKACYPETRLCRRRKAAGLSQSELSRSSGVPLRQIQLFEQRQRKINHTSANTLYNLSKALYCKMEDLLELIAE